MASSEWQAVTGATGFTGRYITQRLLARGERVKTLTAHPARPGAFKTQVPALPFNFDNPDALVESLRGADTLYNTYWIRFPYGVETFDQAVAKSRTLISAAKAAGVRKITHLSIANPDAHSRWAYYRGKALVEEAIMTSGLAYAILRPTVIFGDGGILINNIAWCLRTFPAFLIPGDGRYRLQPVFVEDLADLAVAEGRLSGSVIRDAVGPDVFSFRELVDRVKATVGSRAAILQAPPELGLWGARLAGWVARDVLLTRDELEGLMADVLVSRQPPTGTTRLSAWLAEHAQTLGRQYLNEIQMHFR